MTCRSCARPFDPTPSQVRYSIHACLDCRRRYRRQYMAQTRNRERAAEQQRRYRRRPERRERDRIRARTYRAILRGDLERQPCEVCGDPDAHAHHDDYSRPLDVRWLCPVHHMQHHAEERRQA